MGSMCKLCVGAGVDPKKVTFGEAEDFYKHLEAEHNVAAAEEEGEITTLLDEGEITSSDDAPHHRPRRKK